MSSNSFGKPEYRLVLGYPDIILARDGDVLAAAAPEAGDYAAGLRRVADAVKRDRAPLTVVLPEAEVWRGALDLPPGDRDARCRAAQAAAGAALGLPAEAVVVALGSRGHAGTPVAAVAGATLADTRAMLAAAGIRPAAIVGAGEFAGFPAPPRLVAGAAPRALPRRSAVLGAATVAALLALAVGFRPDAPPPAPTAATAPVVAMATPAAPAAPPPAAAPPVVQAEVRPEPARPRTFHAAPPHARSAAAAPVPAPVQVTVATRNVTLVTPPGGAPELRLPAIAPRPRPATAAAEPPASAGLRPLPRPSHAAAPAPVAAAPAAALPVSAADGRPLPRPTATAGVEVASLAPAAAIATLAAVGAGAIARDDAPPPRPVDLRHKPAAKPAPAKAAKAAAKPKVVAGHTRKPVAAPAPLAAAPARTAAVGKPAVQQVRVVVVDRTPAKPVLRTATVRPAVAKPQRAPVPAVGVKRAAPQSKAPSSALASAAATQRVGLQRGGVSLIGVFGGAGERRALLRMPNGSIQRVAAGDRVQGVQVAAVGPDSVQLHGRGRDTLLKLPD